MSDEKSKKHVIFSMPTMTRPYQQALDSLRDAVPVIEAAGWTHAMVNEIGCPYISAARATMLHKALSAKPAATHIVFLDHDVSYRPVDMLKLLEAEGDVVAGTYRFKKGEAEQGCKDEEYMGNLLSDALGRPQLRSSDGAIKSSFVPAGFLRITRHVVNKFMETFPDLVYGEYCSPAVDLFNHGAYKRTWWGEDAAFSRRWTDECGGEIWVLPDMNIDHSTSDRTYKGNLHEFLMRQPGGSKSACPVSPAQIRERVLKQVAERAAPKEPPPSGQ